jgi:hypothetical protein
MLDDKSLNEFREERRVDEEWRNISYYVIADLLEVCATCGLVAEKERLIRCPSCDDTYCCELCFERHQSAVHPAVSYWKW